MIDLTRNEPPAVAGASSQQTLDDEVRALRSLFDRVGVDAIAALRAEVDRLTAVRASLVAELGLEEAADALTPTAARTRLDAIALGGRAVTRDAAVSRSATSDAVASLLLRAYDAEAERALLLVRTTTLVPTVARLSRARDDLDQLGSIAGCSISVEYHRARIDELHAAAADLDRRERGGVRGEELSDALRTLRSVRTSLLRERAHYERICRTGDAINAAMAATKLTQLAETLRDVAARETALRQEGSATGPG